MKTQTPIIVWVALLASVGVFIAFVVTNEWVIPPVLLLAIVMMLGMKK